MTSPTAKPSMMSPPGVGKLLGVSAEKVIFWIRAGELRAVDVSNHPGTGKPRFRVDPIDLELFLNKRAVVATPKARKRRRAAPDIVQYF